MEQHIFKQIKNIYQMMEKVIIEFKILSHTANTTYAALIQQ